MSMLTALAILALPQVIGNSQAVGNRPELEPSTRDARAWMGAYGGSGADWLVNAAPDGRGGVFVAGYTFSFGAGGSDAWVARVDTMGRQSWELALGGAGADKIHAIVAKADGGCIAVGSTGSSGAGGLDGWVVSLAADGAVQWEQTWGSAGDEVFEAVAVVPGTALAPRYYVGGTAAFGKSGRDAWVLELDAAGVPVWQKSYGGKLDEDLTALAATDDGLVFVTGSRSAFGGAAVAFTRPWLVRLDTAGEPVSQRTFDYSSGDVLGDIVALPDGTFATTGEILAFAFFRGDVWVQRLDANLDVLWDRRFGDNFGNNWVDSGRRVRATPEGDLLVVGSTETAGYGGSDVWLLRLDGAGNLLADRTFGKSGYDTGQALAIDPNGLAFLGGTVQRPPSGGSPDALLARITADSLASSAGTSCVPVLATRPNVWTSALAIGVPSVTSTSSTVVPAFAASTLTPLKTGTVLCR